LPYNDGQDSENKTNNQTSSSKMTHSSHKAETVDDIMPDFDIATEAQMDEMDRMEKKMEIME
jgi:hypothetical protein